MNRRTRGALLLAGLVLVAWTFWRVGWPAIASNLAAIGPWFVLLVAIYFFAKAAFLLGWWLVIDPPLPRSALPRLLGVYLAGYTANYIAPGGVAGEPLKARLLSGTLPPGRALASLTIHKHADMLAQWVFIVTGVTICLVRFPLPAAARWAALGGVALLGALFVLLTWALFRGTYGPILRRLGRWKFLAARVARYQEAAQRVDADIRNFYATRRGRFAAAVGLCFLGWCGGLVETYLVLRLLAPGAGWPTAFAVEAMAMALNNMFLWVPARAGSAEGVRIGVFVLLGLAAAQGAAYALARRAREFVWLLPGALYLIARQARRRPARGAELPIAAEELR